MTPSPALPVRDTQRLLHSLSLALHNAGDAAHPRLFTAGPKGAYPGKGRHPLPMAVACFPRGDGGWPLVHTTIQDPGLDDGGWDPATRRRHATLAVTGKATPIVAFVFMDNSALLARRTQEGLRFYPGVVWLRAQTAGVVIGRRAAYQQAKEPHLFIKQHRRHTWLSHAQCAPDDTTGGQGHEEGTPPASTDGTDAARWVDALATDLDRFDPIFDHPDARTSPFPAFLPRLGWNDDPARREQAARFVAMFLAFGHAALGGTATAVPSLQASLYTFLATPTLRVAPFPADQAIEMDEERLRALLPEKGYAAWRSAVEGGHGRAYHARRDGAVPRLVPRLNALRDHAPEGSAHERLAATARLHTSIEQAIAAWGPPTAPQRDAWHNLLSEWAGS